MKFGDDSKARAAGIEFVRPCTNNAAAKQREITTAIHALAATVPRILPALDALYREGVFRHYADVGYAVIMLARGSETKEQIASYIHANSHCDGVRPEAAS